MALGEVSNPFCNTPNPAPTVLMVLDTFETARFAPKIDVDDVTLSCTVPVPQRIPSIRAVKHQMPELLNLSS